MKKLLRFLFRFIRRYYIPLIFFFLGIVTVFLIRSGIEYTSTDAFCESCHVHPQAISSWKLGQHRDTESGVVAHCTDCHLPPDGWDYLVAKAKTGLRDIFSTLFKDVSRIDWELKSRREHAVRHVYKASCLKCHQNLFPKGLTKKGEDAHLYYEQNAEKLRCINCHLKVGHFHKEEPKLAAMNEKSGKDKVIYTKPAVVTEFKDYTEYIPGTSVSFEMVAIPGGTFTIGSPQDEPYRDEDEGPQRTIEISPFWMGKTEVSWDEYFAFYRQTHREGRSEDQLTTIKKISDVNAITGPTPPYGNPDQGWGRGKRPAITMTYHAATVYCQWLSQVTGKKYRLPTEAEWEYAARGGTTGAYFFEGDPRKFSETRLWNKIFGIDTTINQYVIYRGNSGGKTHLPSAVKPNPFGLLHMLGNVKEFCLDWYAPDAYAAYPADEVIKDPTGPPAGTEHVIRGGSFKSLASEVRVAARESTHHDAWMVTDPQMPKSIWWYSDNNEVGFRVVCEYEQE